MSLVIGVLVRWCCKSLEAMAGGDVSRDAVLAAGNGVRVRETTEGLEGGLWDTLAVLARR